MGEETSIHGWSKNFIKVYSVSVSQFSRIAVSIEVLDLIIIWLWLCYDLITRAVGEHYQKRGSPQQLTDCGQQCTVSVWGAAPTLTFSSRETRFYTQCQLQILSQDGSCCGGKWREREYFSLFLIVKWCHIFKTNCVRQSRVRVQSPDNWWDLTCFNW